MTYAVYMFPEGGDEQELEQLKLKTHLNLAACHLKLENLKQVHSNCLCALRIDKTSVKAHFRRAQAFRLADEYEEAELQLQKAVSR